MVGKRNNRAELRLSGPRGRPPDGAGGLPFMGMMMPEADRNVCHTFGEGRVEPPQPTE